MKNFLKKFRSFRLVASVEGIAGLFGAISALLLLIFYQTNNSWVIDGAEQITIGFHDQPINSMMFFMAGLISVIMGVVAAYSSYPYIMPKDKREPNKFIPWFGVAEAIFSLIAIVYSFVMISYAGSRHSAGIAIFSIVLLLVSAVQLLMIYPTLKFRIRKED